MAVVDPDLISKAIKVLSNSTFSVAMFDPDHKPFTMVLNDQFVADDDGSLEAVGSFDAKAANWATVLEKAVAKYSSIYGNKEGANGVSYGGLTYSGPQATMPMFTGVERSDRYLAGNMTASAITTLFKNEVSKGSVVTCDSGVEATYHDGPVVHSHAYTMLSIEGSEVHVRVSNSFSWFR